MDKKNIKLVIVTIITFIILVIIIWLLAQNKTTAKTMETNEISNINDNNDPIIRDIYHQFNPEDDILFNILGSGNDKETYAYYYKQDKMTYEYLSNEIKNYLTIHSYDYKNSSINKERNCYQVKIKDLEETYKKLFNKNEFKLTNSDYSPKVELINNDTACIYDSINTNYKYTLDTLLVNATYQDDELIIYERVAFIKITNDFVEFYSDYNMENLIYKELKKDINLSFLNNLNIVSNALTKFQDKFNIYTYTFTKNSNNYYFKSITK